MSTLNPSLKIRAVKPRPQRGGQGPVIRFPGNGGGGGGGDRDDSYPDYGGRLRRYRLGLAVGLGAVIMLFVSFTSAYIVRKGMGTWDANTKGYVTDWTPLQLPAGLLLINTVFLLGASLTIEMARRSARQRAAVAPIEAIPGVAAEQKRGIPWLALTVILGVAFLAGQLMAWLEMQRRGFYLASSPSSSFFYVLTGLHGLHLAGGVLALLYAAAASFLPRPLERRRIIIDVTAWYWHFMALLWIYIFALLKFAA